MQTITQFLASVLRMSAFAFRTVLGTYVVANFGFTMNSICDDLLPMESRMASGVRLRFIGEGCVSW